MRLRPNAILAVLASTLVTQAAQAQPNSALGKCTSPQAICALESGGRCNPKTGGWAVGWYNGTMIGGSTEGWQACMDKFHAAKSTR